MAQMVFVEVNYILPMVITDDSDPGKIIIKAVEALPNYAKANKPNSIGVVASDNVVDIPNGMHNTKVIINVKDGTYQEGQTCFEFLKDWEFNDDDEDETGN